MAPFAASGKDLFPRPALALGLGAVLLAAAVILPGHDAVAPPPSAPVPLQVRTAAAPVPLAVGKKAATAFELENTLTPTQRMQRWEPLIAAAAKKFAIPADWIRDVMRAESGGRTLLAENMPIVSDMGAQGLMQLLPGTYKEMRAQYGLGPDVFDPHDNIFAGAAYLKWLRGKYGFPGMFAAYNDGPGLFEDHLFRGRPLPDETKAYVAGITRSLGQGTEWLGTHDQVTVTRPDGTKMAIARADIRGVRPVLPGEYAAGVQAVLDMGKTRQGILESPDFVQAALGRGTRVAALH
jgi:hypothetical protein